MFHCSLDYNLEPGDEYMLTTAESTMRLFNNLAKQLPKKKYYPIFIRHVDAYMKSNDPLKVQAALKNLGHISEYVFDYLKKDLKGLLMGQYINAALSSTNQSCQVGAIYALTFFSHYL